MNKQQLRDKMLCHEMVIKKSVIYASAIHLATNSLNGLWDRIPKRVYVRRMCDRLQYDKMSEESKVLSDRHRLACYGHYDYLVVDINGIRIQMFVYCPNEYGYLIGRQTGSVGNAYYAMVFDSPEDKTNFLLTL